MRRETRARRGVTLIEVSIATAIFAVLAAGFFSVVLDSESVFASTVQSDRARRTLESALQQLREDLIQANPTTLAIDTSDETHDALVLQTPVEIAAGAVTWGATRVEGGVVQSDPGFTVQYLLEEDPETQRLLLLRRVLDLAGNPVGDDRRLTDLVDQPDATRGKGLQAAELDGFVQLELRLASPGAHGSARHQARLAVLLRNP